MNKIITILLVISFTISCSLKAQVPDKIVVKVKKTNSNSITFGQYFNSIMISSLLNKYPNYYNDYLEKFKGFPKGDSIFLTTFNLDHRYFKYNLYKKGYIDYEELIGIDTIAEAHKATPRALNTLIYFENGKQTLIVDENNNFDFSDNEPVLFDKTFRMKSNNSDKINELPIINFEFNSTYQNRIISHNRKVKVYPNSISIFSEQLDENDLVNKTRINIEFVDSWIGKFELNPRKYDVAIQGILPYLNILIKPDSLDFSKNNYDINSDFSYKIKDTIILSEQLYVIDSISDDVSNLFFKKIDSNKEFYSFRTGHKIKDFELTNLKTEKFNVSEITKDKKFTLIDFWGTWCIPCRELTPELKRISQDYASKINIVGVAFDKNIEVVTKYVKKKKMNWVQSFLKNDKRTGIIKDLKIIHYPTFILLDDSRKIIYRGVGKKGISEIEEILKK